MSTTSAQHTNAEHTHAHGDHDAGAPRKYMIILVTLLALTFITVTASKIQFGSPMINVVVALTIATIKASLVALFFMHLIHDKPLNAIIFVASFFFLALFLGSCYTDTFSREDIQPAKLNVKPAIAAPAKPAAAPEGAAAPHH